MSCKNVGPEDSRACLETILAVAEERPDVVLCLDGLAALLKRPQGGSNKPLLRAAAGRPGLRIVATLSRWEFNDRHCRLLRGRGAAATTPGYSQHTAA